MSRIGRSGEGKGGECIKERLELGIKEKDQKHMQLDRPPTCNQEEEGSMQQETKSVRVPPRGKACVLTDGCLTGPPSAPIPPFRGGRLKTSRRDVSRVRTVEMETLGLIWACQAQRDPGNWASAPPTISYQDRIPSL